MPATACNSACHRPPRCGLPLDLLPRGIKTQPYEIASETALDTALDLIAGERPDEADRLLTAVLLAEPDRADLWLAAGIARLRRGAERSAAAALRMATWIGGDSLARDLLSAIES